MKKIYYLKICNTCQRIIKSLELPEILATRSQRTSFVFSGFRPPKVFGGSYETLFSRRAKRYKEMG